MRGSIVRSSVSGLSRRSLLTRGGALAGAALLPWPMRAAEAPPEPGVPTGDTALALGITSLADAALTDRKIARRKVCDLECPSGRIVACDPLVMLGGSKPFARAVPKGRHAAFAYIDLDNDWGERVGLAELRISDAAVTRWQIALVDEALMPEMVGDMISGYGVDAGTGCFCDAATQLALSFYEEMRGLRGAPSYGETELLDAGLAMDKAVEHRLTFIEGSNIAMFHSGFGDGYYASYWGFAADGAAARLVTSFQVFEEAMAVATPPAHTAGTIGGPSGDTKHAPE